MNLTESNIFDPGLVAFRHSEMMDTKQSFAPETVRQEGGREGGTS